MRTSSPKSSQCPVLLVADFDVHCIACYMMLFGTGFEFAREERVAGTIESGGGCFPGSVSKWKTGVC
jgi:hypothetical protein